MVLFSSTVSSASMLSRSLAASSKFSASDACSMRFLRISTCLGSIPFMKPTRSLARSKCSCSVTLETHGAEHLPMSASKQGRFVRLAVANTPKEQDRTGKAFSKVSIVCLSAHAWVYGPKYLTPFSSRFLVTKTRGTLSDRDTAKYGYDLSSLKRMLNGGLNSFIQVNSSCRASNSVFTIVQSTSEALSSILLVRS